MIISDARQIIGFSWCAQSKQGYRFHSKSSSSSTGTCIVNASYIFDIVFDSWNGEKGFDQNI